MRLHQQKVQYYTNTEHKKITYNQLGSTNKNGPRTDPCVTPIFKGGPDDFTLFILWNSPI